jgi:membrane protein
MYERIWEQPHVGGMSGARRCFLWLIGWLVSIQLVSGAVRLLSGPEGLVPGAARLVVQVTLVAGLWLVTSRVLLFGRIGWWRLSVGAVVSGVVLVLYNRGAGLVMPAYVEANAEQFGTLGVILAISTWMIGFGALLVGSALVGRVVSEDPTVLRVVRAMETAVRDATAARRRAAGPPPPPAA